MEDGYYVGIIIGVVATAVAFPALMQLFWRLFDLLFA